MFIEYPVSARHCAGLRCYFMVSWICPQPTARPADLQGSLAARACSVLRAPRQSCLWPTQSSASTQLNPSPFPLRINGPLMACVSSSSTVSVCSLGLAWSPLSLFQLWHLSHCCAQSQAVRGWERDETALRSFWFVINNTVKVEITGEYILLGRSCQWSHSLHWAWRKGAYAGATGGTRNGDLEKWNDQPSSHTVVTFFFLFVKVIHVHCGIFENTK